MPERENKICVSTDVCGVLAHPPDVQSLCERAGFRCNLEVIAMPLQCLYLEGLSRSGCRLNSNVGGVHGKLGVNMDFGGNAEKVFDWFKRGVADALLPPIMDGKRMGVGVLVERIARQTGVDVYLNVHNDEVANNFNSYQRYGNQVRESHLTIENGITRGDVLRVIDLVHKLQDGGAKSTCGTFDVVHAIRAMSDDDMSFDMVKKFWKTTLDQISGDFKHLHFPIGINYDSLPIMEMLKEKKMLKDLGQVVEDRSLKITLENQHNLMWGANWMVEQNRLKRIRAGLIECGFRV